MRIIGAADEFWRVRLTRVDLSDSLDFEWREDILYRAPAVSEPHETERWQIEALRLEDYDTVVQIASYADRTEAEAFLIRVREDLAEMTKTQFEGAYLTPTPAPSADEVAEEPGW